MVRDEAPLSTFGGLHHGRVRAMTENKTSLLYWFPRVVDLGIPVPRTICLSVDESILLPLDGKPLPQSLADEVRSVAAKMGFPLFLRTDLQSGKHGWKDTCFVPSADVLMKNMLGVVEENLVGACMFGPMFEALIFREFLDLETSFIAFYGEMPINKERRYFIRDGEIVCHHPYWPEHAIEEHTKDEDWKTKLTALNKETAEEVKILSDYALRVSAALPGYWSVDFAKAKNGAWYLIDMAEGQQSFHWPNCPKVGR